MIELLRNDVLGRTGDLVSAEQEAECDQQTAGRDERDHVADTGQEDLTEVGAEPYGTGIGIRGRCGGAVNGGGGGILGGAQRFCEHLVRLVDCPLHTGSDDGLTGESFAALHADVGGEDDRGGSGDHRRVKGGASARTLGFDVHLDAGAFTRGDE